MYVVIQADICEKISSCLTFESSLEDLPLVLLSKVNMEHFSERTNNVAKNECLETERER